LNVPIGLICGWLLCRFGIEAAIAAHFTADVIYHVGGTLLLRSREVFYRSKKNLRWKINALP
jgi:hypothetical protein